MPITAGRRIARLTSSANLRDRVVESKRRLSSKKIAGNSCSPINMRSW